jgi:hypothetical protein
MIMEEEGAGMIFSKTTRAARGAEGSNIYRERATGAARVSMGAGTSNRMILRGETMGVGAGGMTAKVWPHSECDAARLPDRSSLTSLRKIHLANPV